MTNTKHNFSVQMLYCQFCYTILDLSHYTHIQSWIKTFCAPGRQLYTLLVLMSICSRYMYIVLVYGFKVCTSTTLKFKLFIL